MSGQSVGHLRMVLEKRVAIRLLALSHRLQVRPDDFV